AVPVRGEEDALAIERPAGDYIRLRMEGEAARLPSRRGYDVDVRALIIGAAECDHRPIGREERLRQEVHAARQHVRLPAIAWNGPELPAVFENDLCFRHRRLAEQE